MANAGYWGPEAILYSSNGAPARSVLIEITDPLTGDLATLYSDAQKTDIIGNPTKTDSLGNLFFFADPGYYSVRLVGSDFVFLAKVEGGSSNGGGTGPAGHEHVQVIAQAVWPVNHDLGRRPASVSVFSMDFSQQYDEFSVQHIDINNLIISMDVPTAGRALM